MRIRNRLCAYHRFWRYRLRTERREIALMLRQRLAGSTVLDVGANRGAYSYWMHRAVGAQGRVIAFEPQVELVEYLGDLKQTLRLNRLTIVSSAVSDQPGEMSLVRPRDHWGGASFHLDASKSNCDVLKVPVTTLDDYISKHDLPPVRFIKCDVQDHEAHVFRGAANLLANQRPMLLFEQEDHCVQNGAAAAFLTELGYQGYFFYRNKLVSTAELTRLRRQIAAPFLNYVFRFERGGSQTRRLKTCREQLVGSHEPS